MGIVNSLLHILFVFFGLAMIGLILLRRGEAGGLGGALGGGMGDTVFGPRATRALDKLIAWCTGLFLLSAVLMYTKIGGHAGGLDSIETEPTKKAADAPKAPGSTPSPETPSTPQPPDGAAPPAGSGSGSGS